ncbi:hypothetical protein [Bdellovibrio sp. NC01]|uniref:hypothetical protein n=1 Tax=Bdellovibrio sp. NC01 TaxID=2220073 RepID=UPI001159FAA7|nr:hypothetical protein [Bdellovibrio sp. NC01]QDK38529.1 hypothetical protein DOE51_13560 [Bdellovibrio sp. NC01]
MQKTGSFLHDRNIWIYYALFFSGTLVLVYQVLGLNLVGDSVNFLCMLFLFNGLHVRRFINIIENSLLMTVGYILPLLIRNSLKLSYAEAPSMFDFAKLALISSITTMALGALFTTVGFLFKHFLKRAVHSKSRITTRGTTSED